MRVNVTSKNDIGDFTRAAARQPGFADAYYNRAIVYLNMRDCPRAMQDFGRAIQLNGQLTMPAGASACVGK